MNKLTRVGSDPWAMLQEFNRLLYPFVKFRSEGEGQEVMASHWMPQIDIREEENRFIIHADVPGVKPADIDVSMQDGMLTIKGSRETRHKEEGKNYVLEERSSGSFLRRIDLPENVSEDKISAECKEGVLEVILPKSKKTGSHKITVKG